MGNKKPSRRHVTTAIIDKHLIVSFEVEDRRGTVKPIHLPMSLQRHYYPKLDRNGDPKDKNSILYHSVTEADLKMDGIDLGEQVFDWYFADGWQIRKKLYHVKSGRFYLVDTMERTAQRGHVYATSGPQCWPCSWDEWLSARFFAIADRLAADHIASIREPQEYIEKHRTRIVVAPKFTLDPVTGDCVERSNPHSAVTYAIARFVEHIKTCGGLSETGAIPKGFESFKVGLSSVCGKANLVETMSRLAVAYLRR